MFKYEVTKDKEEKFTLTVINQKRMGTKKVPWRCLGAGMTAAECKKKQQRVEGLMSVLNQKKPQAPAQRGKVAMVESKSNKVERKRAQEYIAKKIGF